jgi:hypothetical protein
MMRLTDLRRAAHEIEAVRFFSAALFSIDNVIAWKTFVEVRPQGRILDSLFDNGWTGMIYFVQLTGDGVRR